MSGWWKVPVRAVVALLMSVVFVAAAIAGGVVVGRLLMFLVQWIVVDMIGVPASSLGTIFVGGMLLLLFFVPLLVLFYVMARELL